MYFHYSRTTLYAQGADAKTTVIAHLKCIVIYFILVSKALIKHVFKILKKYINQRRKKRKIFKFCNYIFSTIRRMKLYHCKNGF